MSKENPLAVPEREFILEALQQNIRLDGRRADDIRPLDISFGEEYGHVKVRLGQTSLVVRISAEVRKPRDDRPSDGIFQIIIELTAMASPAWENLRSNDLEMYVSRIVDRVVRHSNALDTESLCILKGKSCWGIRADVHVTNYDGNIIDAACIGVMAGLLHFRRPDIEVKEGQVTVFGLDERVPVPLTITHRPLAVTFHIFHEGRVMIVDAMRKEELASEGHLIIALNNTGETCALYKSAGNPVSAIEVVNKTALALQKIKEINAAIDKALQADLNKRAKRDRGAEAAAENDR
ncbi:hypothetical protein VTN31DRAFT_312 [Thermomyces dupontii]|uniref:uncharacterized protein n=1 Tax=Talaromyces thermophilus TaxID=28565 RepID=UPI0037435235